MVALFDEGRIAASAAKTLLGSLVERPGDPVARISELGLAKLEDRAVLQAAVERALGARKAEVARYRAGERSCSASCSGPPCARRRAPPTLRWCGTSCSQRWALKALDQIPALPLYGRALRTAGGG